MCIFNAAWVSSLLPLSVGDTGTEIIDIFLGCKFKANGVQQEKFSGLFSLLFPILIPNPVRMRRIRKERTAALVTGWMLEHLDHPWEISQSPSKRLRSHLSHPNPIPLLLSSFHNSKSDTGIRNTHREATAQ